MRSQKSARRAIVLPRRRIILQGEKLETSFHIAAGAKALALYTRHLGVTLVPIAVLELHVS